MYPTFHCISRLHKLGDIYVLWQENLTYKHNAVLKHTIKGFHLPLRNRWKEQPNVLHLFKDNEKGLSRVQATGRN